MATKIECPGDDELRRLAKHGGEPEEIDRLARHLEACEPCGLAVETLLGANDTLGGQRASSGISVPSGPEVEKAKSLVRKLQPAAAQALANSATIGPATISAANVSASRSSPKSGASTEAGFDYLAPPEQSDELGRLGQFRILKKLGSGGMGVVFLAEDTALDRKVALKTLLSKIAEDATACERFLREARLAASIEHENVVIIYHVAMDRGLPFIAMPLLKGESLEDRLKKTPVLPLRQAIIIARQIAAGLHAAHSRGLIHRDIKPGNVWLESDSKKVKILDFGLARAATDTAHLTQSGAIVGTPAFMAPEQARGVKVDGRADLFSLGCILYQMLTGKRAFTGNDTMSILTSLALDTPARPSEVNPAVPAGVSDVTMKLLEKNPDDRYATAAEVAEALRGFVAAPAGSLAVTANPAPAKSTPATPAKAKPAAASPSVTISARRSPAKTPPAASTRPAARRRIPMMIVAMLGLLLLGVGAIFLSGTVIRIATNKGQLVIENFGDNVDVEINITRLGGTPQVQIVDRESKRTIDLEAGDYAIDVKEKNGLAFQTDKFTLMRGGVERVRVKFEPGVARNKEKNVPPILPVSPGTNSGLEFNGVDSGVEVPSLCFDGSHPLTIEAKLRFDDLTGTQIIAGWSGVSWLYTGDDWMTFNGFTADVQNFGSSIALGKGAQTKFIHVAGVYDGKSVRVFNNGIAGKPTEIAHIRNTSIVGGLNADHFAIGCQINDVRSLNRKKGYFLKAVIDEVRISKVARYTDSFLPAEGNFQSDKDTMALYRFDEGQGTIAKDASGNGHDGKITGAKWVTISPGSISNPPVLPPPSPISEPSPLAEWLKGRTVLTVSQDGKAQYKTIQAALNALKPGEVVKVLDRGPYRENLLLKNTPSDVGLISEKQTVLELVNWTPVEDTGSTYRCEYGHQINDVQGFRLSGFEIRHQPNRDAKDGNLVQTAVRFQTPQGLVVEDCAFVGARGSKARSIGLACEGSGVDPTDPLVVRGCFLDLSEIIMNCWEDRTAAPILIEKNYSRQADNNSCLLIQGPQRKVVVRHNILEARALTCGIVVSQRPEYAPAIFEFSNNTSPNSAIHYFQPGRPQDLVTLRNNILTAFRTIDAKFQYQPADEVRQKWKISNNSYMIPPENGGDRASLVYRFPGDSRETPEFLSKNFKDANFLRVASDSPLARGGAGGTWPSYVGALTPGPAPEGGDWFIQLRERWVESTAVKKADVGPPPFADWLKGRTVLTVSQDGKAQYKTIQAALDALKPGQVVKVLDKGPYRETLKLFSPPRDTGLVSEAQTRIEVAELTPLEDKFSKNLVGHQFISASGFRVAGFEFISEENSELWVHALRFSQSEGTVVEDCHFARAKSSKPGKGVVPLKGFWNNNHLSAPFVVRECRFSGGTVYFQGRNGSAPVLIEKCHLTDKTTMIFESQMRSMVIRENVLETDSWGVQFHLLNDVRNLRIQNNTIARASNNPFQAKAPVNGLAICNNILKQPFTIDPAALGKDAVIGHNAYTAANPAGRQPQDLAAPVEFLSLQPGNRDSFRIAADNPVAITGAGGEWPKFIGALPPEPAPKDGDWFTRLRERWAD